MIFSFGIARLMSKVGLPAGVYLPYGDFFYILIGDVLEC